MRINIVKSKNSEQVYIIKSYRKGKKTTSKIFKKLGTMASLLPQFNNDRDQVIAWAKEQAAFYTLAERNEQLKVSVDFSEGKQIKMNERVLFNGGYLFLQKLFYELGLNDICKVVESRHGFSYDLTEILSNLIYSRIIHPTSKRSSFEFSQNYIEQPKHELHHIYRALDILADESDYIQAQVYANSTLASQRNTGVLYYDCTNYFFEIDKESGLKQYGVSKEHRPNPIVQMGLFLDGDGIPLAFSIFPGNESEQPSLIPLEKQIIKDFELSRFIVCTDAGLSSTENRKFNDIQNRSFIVTQSLKKMKKIYKDWVLSPTGWRIGEEEKEYDLTSVDEEQYYKTVFHKERWIHDNEFEQRLIVTFSFKYRNYQRSIRERQINRAETIISKGKAAKTRNPNSPDRFIQENNLTDDGEIATQITMTLNEEKIADEESFDGFYAVCTTLEDNVSEIIKINQYRWKIESAFRVMKTEFKARPAYVRTDDRIKAHFLTCYLALLILRILEKRLDNSFSTEEILKALREHNFYKIDGFGYTPAYQRTVLTDALHDAFGFRTDTEIISEKKIKKIIAETKR